MATQAHSEAMRAAKRCVCALLAGALVALCTPRAAQAEESAHAQLTVAAVVRSSCKVDAAASVAGASDAANGVALQCSPSVAPRTSVAYEVVGPQGGTSSASAADDQHLVVTVLF